MLCCAAEPEQPGEDAAAPGEVPHPHDSTAVWHDLSGGEGRHSARWAFILLPSNNMAFDSNTCREHKENKNGQEGLGVLPSLS